MVLNCRNIKRWYLMLTGKSIWHVNQDIGKCFSTDSIKGYYNNMTEKVTKMPELLDNDGLPLLNTGNGEVEMPVAIFQYGLGAYDLYLQTGDKKYLKKFIQTVMWAISNQDGEGRWDTFSYIYPDNPYGAMSQGEGASLLLRAYIHTGDTCYLKSAKKAIDFMLKPLEDGGTTLYNNEKVIFKEYTHLPTVLNGWIFSWWGLYDYVLTTHDDGQYKKLMEASLRTLIEMMPQFSCFYWSLYDLDNKITSPFYHHLQIAQMQALYILTKEKVFNAYAKKWQKNEGNVVCKIVAFSYKAYQKLKE